MKAVWKVAHWAAQSAAGLAGEMAVKWVVLRVVRWAAHLVYSTVASMADEKAAWMAALLGLTMVVQTAGRKAGETAERWDARLADDWAVPSATLWAA